VLPISSTKKEPAFSLLFSIVYKNYRANVSMKNYKVVSIDGDEPVNGCSRWGKTRLSSYL
jgi:hypothetical protein